MQLVDYAWNYSAQIAIIIASYKHMHSPSYVLLFLFHAPKTLAWLFNVLLEMAIKLPEPAKTFTSREHYQVLIHSCTCMHAST